MKIVKLTASNILRLVAVDITPEGDVVTIGGKNAAGKSSVLNAIAMALGGKELVPEEPIRQGQSEASVRLDLGDYVVTRTFSRTAEGNGWGPMRSTLTVKTKDGAKYNSPQTLLTSLLGSLTFDPFAFANEKDPRKQAEVLAALVGYDTIKIDTKIKRIFDDRTFLNRELAKASALADHAVTYPEAGTGEITSEDVAAELERAAELQRAATAADEVLRNAQTQVARVEENQVTNNHAITNLEEQIADLQREHELALTRKVNLVSVLANWKRDQAAAQLAADAAHAAVPNTDALKARIAEVDDHNTKVRANVAAGLLTADVERHVAAVADADRQLTEARQQKADQIAALSFPVPGLLLLDGRITFGGVPFAQASTAERLAVSVAVGAALHPTLRVMLIRDGALMDDDTMRVMADLAATHETQLWIERVSKPGEPVSVLIADGAEVK